MTTIRVNAGGHMTPEDEHKLRHNKGGWVPRELVTKLLADYDEAREQRDEADRTAETRARLDRNRIDGLERVIDEQTRNQLEASDDYDKLRESLEAALADLNEAEEERDRARRDMTAARAALFADRDEQFSTILEQNDKLRAENDSLKLKITPGQETFLRAILTESVRQRDGGHSPKEPQEWVALIAELVGNAASALRDGDRTTGMRHIITTAAACANWHAMADPVRAAFERAPARDAPLTDEQKEKRARGLADLAAGRFVNPEDERNGQ